MLYIISIALVIAGFILALGTSMGGLAIAVAAIGLFILGHAVSGEDLVY